MMMTNYMEVLMSNQPWNLIAFMVLPVAMAELLTAAERCILARPEQSAGWKRLSHGLGIALGLYFLGVFLYFVLHILPGNTLRGWIDELAIAAYLAGVLPLGAIALQELGLFGGPAAKRQWHHILLLISFLVVSHIAMIFGMVDPTLSGWQPPMPQTEMQHMGHMPHKDQPGMGSSMHHDSMHMDHN